MLKHIHNYLRNIFTNHVKIITRRAVMDVMELFNLDYFSF